MEIYDKLADETGVQSARTEASVKSVASCSVERVGQCTLNKSPPLHISAAASVA